VQSHRTHSLSSHEIVDIYIPTLMENGDHRRLDGGGGFLSKGGILKGGGEKKEWGRERGVLGEKSFHQQPFNKMLLLYDGCFGR